MAAKTTSPHSKRDEIIDIASRLFYEQGFGATGIKQIIEEAGIAKGTFYSHFQSKEELGVVWLQTRHKIWNQWFEGCVSKIEGVERILSTFDFLQEWLEKSDFRGCAFINTMAEIPDSSSPMRKQVLAHKRGLHDRFQQLTAEHFQNFGENGAADSADSAQRATIIYLLFEGALVESQNFRETWPIQAARKQVAGLLSA